MVAGDPQRMLEADELCLAVLVTEDEQVFPDKGGDNPALEVDVAHRTDLGIRDIQVPVEDGQTTRQGEPRLRFRSLPHSPSTATGTPPSRLSIVASRPAFTS